MTNDEKYQQMKDMLNNLRDHMLVELVVDGFDEKEAHEIVTDIMTGDK